MTMELSEETRADIAHFAATRLRVTETPGVVLWISVPDADDPSLVHNQAFYLDEDLLKSLEKSLRDESGTTTVLVVRDGQMWTDTIAGPS